MSAKMTDRKATLDVGATLCERRQARGMFFICYINTIIFCVAI